MVIKNTPYVCITHSIDAGVLLINWKRCPSTKQLKDSYLAALEYVHHGSLVTSFCTDLSTSGPLSREQEAWLMLEFYPKVYEVIQSSINAAVVFTEEHFKAIVTNYQQPAYFTRQTFIHFNYFTEIREAQHWLAAIKKGQDTLSAMSF